MPKINLAAVRTNADKTQREWADILGVSVQTVGNWETGKTSPDLQTVRKMSELSGIPLDFIFVPDKSNKIDI